MSIGTRLHHDRWFKEALRFWQGQSLAVLGLDLPPIAGVLNGELTENLRGYSTDKLFALVDAQRLHFEFQTQVASSETMERFCVYDALIRRRDHMPVHTVVLYGRGVRMAPTGLEGGSLVYRVTNCLVGQWDGWAQLSAIEAKVASGLPLERDDALRLALAGFMGFGPDEVADAVRRAAELCQYVPDPEARSLCRLAVYTFAFDVAGPDEATRILEVIRMAGHVALADALEAVSRAEGEQRQAARALLKILTHRYGTIPEALVDRVRAESSVAALERWFDLALDAPDLAAVERAMAQGG